MTVILFFFVSCYVFPHPTSCIYVHVGKTSSITDTLLSFQNNAISLQDDTQVKVLSTAARIPPVEIWIFHCANPPSPTPPHTLVPCLPQWRTVDPTSFFTAVFTRQEPCPGNKPQLESILSSHLTSLGLRDEITRGAICKTERTATGLLSQVFTSQPESFLLT